MEPIWSREILIARIESGMTPRFLHFWGHKPEKSGDIGRGCLSQWWEQTFEHEGVSYHSAEHWMMAGKARLFGDDATLEQILAAPHPEAAKAFGRQVRGFVDATWNAARFDLVVRGNVLKFGQNAAMKAFLLGTGEQVLVEASPRDRIWGIGMGASNPDANHPERWRGLNLLGFALMEARARLGA